MRNLPIELIYMYYISMLVRLRADDRQGGDTVDGDVRELLRETAEGSDESSGVPGGVADGDDNDSALWSFEKYRA